METLALREQIESIDTLPTIPTVLKNILRVIEDPKVSLQEIGSFISSDPVLASRVLKVVNSPIYGFSGRISSVNQALLLLGLKVVRGMLFGVSVFEIMERSMEGLWAHSLGCAVTSRIIAQKKGLDEPEEVSVGGLLHDIGKVALNLKFPAEYQEVLAAAAAEELYILQAEERRFPANHAAPGAWIGQKWNFPRTLVEMIGYHHKPQLSRNVPVQTAIVHIADILVRAKGFGFGGDPFVPPVQPAAWDLLGLGDDDLGEIVTEMDDMLGRSEDFLQLDD